MLRLCACACVFQYVDENLAVMSIGFLLSSPDDAVIWRGPKKNGVYVFIFVSQMCIFAQTNERSGVLFQSFITKLTMKRFFYLCMGVSHAQLVVIRGK